jgi:hypothetical protein
LTDRKQNCSPSTSRPTRYPEDPALENPDQRVADLAVLGPLQLPMHGRPAWSLKLDIISDVIRPWDDTIIETASAVVVLVRVPINAAPVVLPTKCYKRFN